MSAPTIAVIAHTGKTLDGGPDRLRAALIRRGLQNLRWYEISKSRKAPNKVRKALRHRPDLLLLWGGDGLVQRCVDALDGHDLPIGVIPAGTANLLARNLDIPISLDDAVEVALHGVNRRIDVGVCNGERFTVMAGLGFDAAMIDNADGALKDRLGRLAYLWTGAQQLNTDTVRMRIKVDGSRWFDGPASCVLVGNVPKVFGAVQVFDQARPDDGLLDVAVATAATPTEWTRTLTTVATGSPDRSRFVSTTRGRKLSVKLSGTLRYEIDGGARALTDRLKVRVVAAGLRVRVPATDHPPAG